MEPIDSPPARQFTIQQISDKLNIPKPTLRFWEKELDGIITPFRTDGGQRRYSIEHIAVIEKIRELRNSGKSLYEIKSYLNNGNRSNDRPLGYDGIDLLSERIAEVVKLEINRFFQTKEP